MMQSADPVRLELRVVGGDALEFAPEALVIAGFTGRDRAAVEHHIVELEAMGVERPPETPAFYDVPLSLLTTEADITVTGRETSGEVEPVLFRTPHGAFVGVGSDHTDRRLERTDIALSKRACPKVIGRDVVPYEEAVERWEEIALRCRLADGSVYQSGRAAELLPIPDLLTEIEARRGRLPDGLVLFLGTVPLQTDSFVFSERYELDLALKDGPRLSCAYRVSMAEEAAE